MGYPPFVGTGPYFEEEKKRYEPIWADPTGHLQELIAQKFKEFSDREVRRTYEIALLQAKIKGLEERLEKIEKQNQFSATAEIIEIREIPLEQVKKEMIKLLSDGKTRYADEISAELKLDIKDVTEAFEQLQKEGKLFIDESKL